MQSRGMARHFEGRVYSFAVRDVANSRGDPLAPVGLRIQDMIDAQLFGDREAIVARIRGDDARGSGNTSYGGGKETGRPASRDKDRMTGEIFCEGGVHRIAERFLNRGQLRWNLGRRFPQHAFRQDDVLGKGSIAVHAENAIISAHVRLAGPALEADSACQMRFGRHIVANFDEGNIGADLHDFPAHFMSDNARRLNAAVGPFVPIVNVGIGAA